MNVRYLDEKAVWDGFANLSVVSGGGDVSSRTGPVGVHELA